MKNRGMEQPRPAGVVVGTVKNWNDERGFGFIEAPGQEADVFVHRTAIVDDGRNGMGRGVHLERGDQVEFEVVAGRGGKGPQALNVRVI